MSDVWWLLEREESQHATDVVECNLSMDTNDDRGTQWNFCGEVFSPACAQCKDNPNDPFNSFPTPFQPPSLVSHWLLPYNVNLPQNPSSIASLRTH